MLAPEANGEPRMRPEGPHSFIDEERVSSEAVNTIMELALKERYITFDNTGLIIKEADLDEEECLTLFQQLDEMGIEIVETTPPNDEHIKEKKEVDFKAEFSTDGVRSFLAKAAKLPLLTAQQEKILGYHIQNGDETSRQKMIEHNIRLAASIAKRYLGNGLPMEDLLSFGIVGLDRAARKFDPDKGYKFSTYATWWIQQMIQRGLDDTGGTIRTPVHVRERRGKMNKAEKDLVQELDRQPTLEEIAEASGLPLKQVREVANAARVTASLDQPVGNDDGTEFGNFFANGNSEEAAEVAIQNERRRALLKALMTLNEEERDVLTLCFGLLDDKEHTAAEISGLTGIPAQKIGELKKEALRKLEKVGELAELVINDSFELETVAQSTGPPIAVTIDGEKVDFTANEYAVMLGLQKDLSYAQISGELNMKGSTAKGLGPKIYGKLKVPNKDKATAKLRTIDLTNYEIVAQ